MHKVIASIPFIFCLLSFAYFESYYSSFWPKENKTYTRIKKQQWGTCWSFSAISTLESSILTQGLNHTTDLSEYHLDKFNGFNRNGQNKDPRDDWFSSQGEGFTGSNTDNTNSGLLVHLGGDFFVATAYLANTLGAVEESKTPKISNNNDFKNFGWTPKDGVLLHNDYKYVYPKRVEWLSRNGTEKQIRKRIKNYIRMHGSVSSAQYMNPIPTGHYKGMEVHLNLKENAPNHAINIVGWNDNFYYKGHQGAWIIKDSDHEIDPSGDKLGLFYIPYSDLITGKDRDMGAVSFNDIRVRSKHERIYTHSLHGWRHEHRFDSPVKSRFISSNENQIVTGIGIYIPTEKTLSNLTILVNSKRKEELKPFYARHPGFYFIDTPEIELSANSQIDIIQENSSKIYAIDSTSKIEVLLGNQLIKPEVVESQSKVNQSYIKSNEKWVDLKFQKRTKKIDFSKANFSINLYTKRVQNK